MSDREEEIQEALTKFIREQSEKTKGMTQEEERKYIKEERINEKMKQLVNEIKQKHGI